MELTNQIGIGAQADIYLWENRAVKVYKHGECIDEAKLEAYKQNLAYESGLPVPKIYDVVHIEDKPAVIMAYLSGQSLGELIKTDSTHAPQYLAIALDTQLMIHQVKGEGFPSLKERLHQKIERTSLSDKYKQIILTAMEQMIFDTYLCHGDLHIYNLIQTNEKVHIIDWVDATSGSPDADICRTYLLYLQFSEAFARMYLEMYCEKTNQPPEKVLDWLPILAAARLSDYVPSDDRELLLEIVDQFCTKRE